MTKLNVYDHYALNVNLRGYAGRRLQYAIRLGILPGPESLNQVLNRKEVKNAV